MAAKTWDRRVVEDGGGGNAWDSFSYDPELDLLYIGTGNGGPWSQHWRSPGGGDNLFLTSIVALNADTGEYVWHYQTVPGDNWDYTATSTMMLADLAIDGQPRKVLMQAPKNGFFYVHRSRDRRAHLRREDHRQVTWATQRGPARPGRPVENPPSRATTRPASWSLRVREGRTTGTRCRSVRARGWSIFLARTQNFHRLEPTTSRNSAEPALGPSRGPSRDSGARRLQPAGFLIARDPVTQRDRWRIDLPSGGTAASW